MDFNYDNDKVLISIKRNVLMVCKEVVHLLDSQGFKYTMVGGTAIGAVRHKGYIPWDDDIDLGMPRPEYERLLNFVKENGLPEGLQVRTIFNTPGYDLYWLQFVRYIDGIEAYVDIFPMDGVPKSQLAFWCWLKMRNFCLQCAYAYQAKGVRRLLLYFFGRIMFGIPFRASQLERKIGYDRYLKSYSYDKAKRAAQVVWGPSKIMLRMKQTPADYRNVIRLPFEDTELSILANYDDFLTQQFGDYMTLPPVEERVPRHRFDASSGTVKACQ